MSVDLFERGLDGLATGATFASAPRTVTEKDVLAFADITGDHNPLHVDPVKARESQFGEQIAQGMLVASFALAALTTAPDGVALRTIRQAVFKRPVALGTTITVHGEVGRIRKAGRDAVLVELALRVVDDDGRLLVALTIELLWRR